jgi:heme-degrading monooxygenase HmoA
MILEIADIRINEENYAKFENAVQIALTNVFPNASGFYGHSFHRCIETPGRYVLQLTWETLEDHTVKFRGSPLFAEWRALVGEFFTQPPHVEHFQMLQSKI